MNTHRTGDVRIILPQTALTVIFDECDRFDHDETGGRIIGTFTDDGGKLTIQVTGIIEPGPNAQRTRVSLFQDGEHQERVFRQVERRHPEIEHLGTWHTHHVNGLPTLSTGDITTYRKTVNHHNQNTPFFYALLVVAKREVKNPEERYSIKHFLFRRHDQHVYEIPSRHVEIVDTSLIWPSAATSAAKHGDSHPPAAQLGVKPERVYDRDILAEFYQGVRPFTSPKLGFYWRGPIELSDGSRIEIVLMEDSSSHISSYALVLRDVPDALREVAEHLAKQEFPSARAALIATERSCNRVLYERRVCDGDKGKTEG